MARPSRTSRTLTACAAALVLMALAGCSPTSTAAGSGTSAPGNVASTAATDPSSTPSSPGHSTPAADPPTPEAGYDNYPAAPTGASAIKLTTPCDSGTLTMTAHPDGKGVAMSATLKNPAHDHGWHGSIGITPFANDAGDPDLPPLTLAHGELTLSGTNLTGPRAVHDSHLNYAWPQYAGVGLSLGKPDRECDARVYLNATTGTVNTFAFTATIHRDTGAIKVLAAPLAGPGPWQITATATSPDGSQRQTRTGTASAGATIGGPFGLTTTLTGFTHLDDFTALTITSAKVDGTDPVWLTLTRTP